jgi:hypothetical protein
MEAAGDKEDAKKQKVAVAEVNTAAEVAPEVSVKLEKGKMQQSIQSSLQACTVHRMYIILIVILSILASIIGVSGIRMVLSEIRISALSRVV